MKFTVVFIGQGEGRNDPPVICVIYIIHPKNNIISKEPKALGITYVKLSSIIFFYSFKQTEGRSQEGGSFFRK